MICQIWCLYHKYENPQFDHLLMYVNLRRFLHDYENTTSSKNAAQILINPHRNLEVALKIVGKSCWLSMHVYTHRGFMIQGRQRSQMVTTGSDSVPLCRKRIIVIRSRWPKIRIYTFPIPFPIALEILTASKLYSELTEQRPHYTLFCVV